MTANYLYSALDATGGTGVWITNGTVAGTNEILSGKQGTNELEPFDFTVFDDEVLFAGYDASGNIGIWATNGTTAGTSEIVAFTPGSYEPGPAYFTVIVH